MWFLGCEHSLAGSTKVKENEQWWGSYLGGKRKYALDLLKYADTLDIKPVATLMDLVVKLNEKDGDPLTVPTHYKTIVVIGQVSKPREEAEYRSLANSTYEIPWLNCLLHELGINIPTPTLVMCDNASIIALANNPVQHARTKHIEIDCHFVRDKIRQGHIEPLFVTSQSQVADILTKGLSKDLHYNCLSKLSICDPYIVSTYGGIKELPILPCQQMASQVSTVSKDTVNTRFSLISIDACRNVELLAGEGAGNMIARRVTNDLISFSGETSPSKYMKFFLEQKAAERRRFVNHIHAEVATSSDCIAQLTAVISEFEAMKNQDEVRDCLLAAKDAKRGEQAKRDALNEVIAEALDEIETQETNVKILDGAGMVFDSGLLIKLLVVCVCLKVYLLFEGYVRFWLCMYGWYEGERIPKKGQNQIKTGQKREAWRSREKLKAVTVNKERKTEENAKRRARNAKSYKLY
nr:homogeneously-staining region [Tanacetum cinerariifolium]